MWQGVSLPGGPERQFHESVEVKPLFHWRHQDIGDARTVECQSQKLSGMEWKEIKKDHVGYSSRLRCCYQRLLEPMRCYELQKPAKQQPQEFGVFPATF